ncbi:MAG: hypothetical protein P1U86_17980 [Verrucomicrobiales bacterium]|nr:hypothetical protein [Verrucomicrobiales bacterium]
MKSALRFLLLLAVVNSVVEADAGFRVGRGLVDISPPVGVSMAGAISQNAPVKEIHDPLHVRALLFSDGKRKVGLATVDNTMISDAIFDEAKRRIEAETGIPGSHLILAATHSHSTPRGVVGLVKEAASEAYLDSLSVSIAEAFRLADADLQPATAAWTSVDVPDFLFNRRWFVEDSAKIKNPFGEDGEIVRMNPGRKGLIKPAGPVDPELSLLSIRNPGGAPIAVMGNYGLHYVGGSGPGEVSADYFGVFSEALRAIPGADETFLGLMSNGTSGDVNAVDFSAEAVKYQRYENMERVGRALAKTAIRQLDGIRHEAPLEVDAAEVILKLKVRKPDAERLAWAKANAAPPDSRIRLTKSQVYAKETLGLAGYPDKVEVRIQAIRVGDLAIVGIPCEVFAATGLAIKEASAFPASFIMELANGYHGYLPSAQQHEWGGYETWAARSAYLEVNAEEKIRDAAIALLNELKQ